MAGSDVTRCDPSVFQRNVDALAQQQPELGSLLESMPIPNDVLLTSGRDGSTTYRLPDGNGGRYWLGHSSMPSVSTPALMSDFLHGSGNTLLPTIGHGGEAGHLLASMGSHQAVFTWDSDPLVPALALRLHDFSAEIRRGRLILAIGSQPGPALWSTIEHFPMHLSPSTLFSAPHLSFADIRELQTQAEQLAVTRNRDLLQVAAQISERLSGGEPPAPRAGCRLLLLSLIVDPEVARVAEALARAGRQTGLDCVSHTADSPDQVHIASAALQIERYQPTEVILFDQVRSEWGALLAGVQSCVTWCVASGGCRPEMLLARTARDTIWISNMDQARAASMENAAAPTVRYLGPAADESLFHPEQLNPADRQKYGGDLAIIMSAVDFSAESVGLKWESHKALLNAIVRLLRNDPVRLGRASAERLISKAGRQHNINLDSDDLRADLASFIMAGVAPTLTVLKLLHLLRGSDLKVVLWGGNWHHHDAAARASVLPAPSTIERNKIYNATSMIIHLRNDQWHIQHLFDALAAGCDVLAQSEDKSTAESLPEPLSAFLQAQPSFDRPETAARIISGWFSDPTKRAAASRPARQLVMERHLMSHRLSALRK